MPLAAGSTFAGYTIVRQLGTGGMGEVYRAQHPRWPRQDALKVLRPEVSADHEYRQRFHREADAAAALWHPHIVAVHDRGETDGQLWIDMDYVDGTDAVTLLRDRYPNGMPGSEVSEIITAVAEALDYAHDHKLLHRDVKPANILIAAPASQAKRIMLADFGIAGWVGEASGLTATNMTVGTVSYAPPEQLMGHDLDGKADQYALAATAYHLLMGSPPFQHSNPAVVISQHLSAAPPAIGQRLPALAELDPVFAKALAKDPKDRYQRCIDFARALSHRLGGVGDPDDTRISRPVAVAVPAAKNSLARASVIVPAVLAILLVVAIAVALREFERADDERVAPPAATSSSRPSPTAAKTSTTTATTTAPTSTSTSTAAATTESVTPAPVVVIGAMCSPLGSTGTTKTRATAYCSTLQGTNTTIWSLTEGTVASPTVSATPDPTEPPLPIDQDSPIRICMQQTGQTRHECREDIRRSNGY
ncbi:Serine/threonine-protein kinase PknF [Mycobacterium shottsii]|uniref:non-specific serine/threonine protein kinase n=1 Tax=Mycobacterium shottsii TaxID=133549 RepID=A0A7I7LGN5_9MYCO|nr:serine/threonine-protein kinase [Mycobacterium shottsii]QYL28549.1 Serine/threonine-protein kinase PknF [Mycobacterium shottsii]BBX58549.1 serine/threonine-protein kinase PknF [Mycobacterium shottsii]